MKSIKAFRTTEMIIQTTTFDPKHGQWSFIVLDGSIDIIEKDDDVYHIALHSKALVMVYRHNEYGIQFARLYFNASSTLQCSESHTDQKQSPELVIIKNPA